MCGIVGIYHFDKAKNVDESILKLMRDTMIHRGPNDSGVYLNRNLGLGHRRLSIIDLSGGHQPLSNETNEIWVVFNGEIFNFHELSKTLISEGHQFKTKSDTETIVHLYEKMGLRFPELCNGMFAIAIWDSKKSRLVLVRDRLGVKPLYYYKNDTLIAFASEIKALLSHPDIRSEVNQQVLEEYLVFRYISGNQTLFKNIYRLLPGHMIIVENNKSKEVEYWDLPSSNEDVNENEIEDKIVYLLEDSVKLRLISDVPLGAYCSGGIDSSLVTAISTKYSNTNLNTFCIGFEDPKWDETPYALKTAKRYNTLHHEIFIKEEHFIKSLEKLSWYFDEPISHPNSVPIYYLSKYARDFVVVTLTGEGADELFLGYPRYNILKLLNIVKYAPAEIKNISGAVLKLFAHNKAQKLGHSLSLSSQNAVLFNSCYNSHTFVESILARDAGNEWLSYRINCFNRTQNKKNLLEKLQYIELKTYLVSALERLDRMSMSVSMESRVPFLDYRLVEYVMSLPIRLNKKGFQNKYLLKKIAERYIPHDVIYRSKSGFGVPLADWMRNKNGLGKILYQVVNEKSEALSYFNKERLLTILSEHQEGLRDHSEILWLFMNFCNWHNIFIEKKQTLNK